jgi:hypothetical protein
MEMEKGLIDKGLWIEGEWNGLVKAMTRPIGRKFSFTIAWHCPNCKKIELYSEDSK